MTERDMLISSPGIGSNEQEIEDARIALLNNNASASQFALIKNNIEQRKKALGVYIDESKIYDTKMLAENLSALTNILVDEEVIAAVKEGIINSKDPAKSYNEFSKAVNENYNRMMKQQLSSADPEAAMNKASGRSIKIAVTDSTGTTMVAID